MKEAQVPGVSVALVKDGALFWRRGFGVRDIRTKEPVDVNSVFEAASTSKPVFAYAVMKLRERGVIDLDTPLSRYTPDRPLEGDARLELITARHVLSHTSGLPNWRSKQEPLSIRFTPGERWNYSGEGYSYLQSVVSRLTGSRVDPAQCGTFEAGLKVCAMEPSLDQYMQANVLRPFGMASSGFLWTNRWRPTSPGVTTRKDSHLRRAESRPLRPSRDMAWRVASAPPPRTTRDSSSRSSIRGRLTRSG